MAGDHPRLIRCHLAGGLIEERATESEPVGVVPFLVDVGCIPHAAVVAVLVGLVELVGELGQAVPSNWTVGDVELSGIDACFLEHTLVVVKSARVSIKGQGVGLTVEVRLGPREGDVNLAEVLASHEFGQVLQHTLRGALGDDETVEQVDVRAHAAADSGHELGRVGLAADDLNQFGLHVAVLAIEIVDDLLQAAQVRFVMGCPEGDLRGVLGASRVGAEGRADRCRGETERGGALDEMPAGDTPAAHLPDEVINHRVTHESSPFIETGVTGAPLRRSLPCHASQTTTPGAWKEARHCWPVSNASSTGWGASGFLGLCSVALPSSKKMKNGRALVRRSDQE